MKQDFRLCQSTASSLADVCRAVLLCRIRRPVCTAGGHSRLSQQMGSRTAVAEIASMLQQASLDRQCQVSTSSWRDPDLQDPQSRWLWVLPK